MFVQRHPRKRNQTSYTAYKRICSLSHSHLGRMLVFSAFFGLGLGAVGVLRVLHDLFRALVVSFGLFRPGFGVGYVQVEVFSFPLFEVLPDA